jgi:hypothetical protein
MVHSAAPERGLGVKKSGHGVDIRKVERPRQCDEGTH